MNNLVLSNNFLKELPDSIGNLVSLTHLEVNGNQIDGSLPSSIGNLSLLRVFTINSLRGSQLTNIPLEIADRRGIVIAAANYVRT
jgi:Leucine-rich repeat (LRR) protein